MLEITIVDFNNPDLDAYLAIVNWPVLPDVGEDIFIAGFWYTVKRRRWSTIPKWITVHEHEVDTKNVGVTLEVVRQPSAIL